ncbi:MAG: tyrosine recombinase XerC [Limisphaerales bacterium]
MIYRSQKPVAGKPYVRYRLSIYDADGRRTLRDFADFGEAVEAARQRLEAQSRGHVLAETLTGSELAEYRAAVDALPEGVALREAVATYAEAGKRLGSVPLLEAAKDYARRFPATMPRITVSDAVAQFLGAKRQDQLSARHIDDLRLSCERLQRSFTGGLLTVTGPALREWFEQQQLGPRSWNNLRNSLVTFFMFAIRRGWLPRDWHEFEAVEVRRVRGGAITTYTADELSRLLAAAPPKLLPVVAVQAFTGARGEEARRLDWQNIRLADGLVELAADKTKTRSRRLVPVLDALRAWLGDLQPVDGHAPLWNDSRPYYFEAMRNLAQAAGVTLRPNALRHTWISARVAVVKNVNEVALEAGNSPQIIFANYRELMTPAQAEAWFGVMPSRPANVVALPKVA